MRIGSRILGTQQAALVTVSRPRHRDRTENLWHLGGRYIEDGYACRELFRGPIRYGRIYEHRAVMEELLDRPLEGAERIHHINGKKTDNRPENLALCSNLAAHRWCHTEEARIFLG